ncbi:High affinity cationic amino acid transporter 1 [Cichlidogyrus casuarinus]|uniref:High affinity cationic amino acid transporter 1 n=1 Tax=Cichlidogyrus casuarinus TaxID=1844966 RepID=A0ABD2QI36_9PLAT
MRVSSLRSFASSITRRKHTTPARTRDNETRREKLSAVLSTFDLVQLGVGSILGAGIYVVLGEVVWLKTGPATILSFLIAAFASLLAGLCYAEFGSRVPHTTGSAYAYSYHTVGEFFAFAIGWNLILEYIIGTAADARALSGAIDHLTGNHIRNFTLANFGVLPYFQYEYDFLAAILSFIITIILSIGVKESARCTTIFNFVNIGIAIFIIVVSSTKANPSIWSATPDSFAPTGLAGILSGAATCFYAFVGFDIVATTGEEALSPSRSIPIAISLTLVICLVLYIGCGLVLSMLVPFREKALLSSTSLITKALELTPGLNWATPVVGIGAAAGLTSSLLGSQFPLPRIVYAMAKDGLLFEFFQHVNKRTETALLATLVPGLITCVFSALFDLSSLVEMMSSGTLLAYSLVCTSVLILHYQIASHTADVKMPLLENEETEQPRVPTGSEPHATNKVVNTCTFFIWLCSYSIGLIFVVNDGKFRTMDSYAVFLLIVLLTTALVLLLIIATQQKDQFTLNSLYFRVPLVPVIPALAIFIHSFLMCQLSAVTWVRFSIWNAVGFAIYFGYGIKHAQKQFDQSDLIMKEINSNDNLAN